MVGGDKRSGGGFEGSYRTIFRFSDPIILGRPTSGGSGGMK